VQRLAWPAHEAEPALENERYKIQGAAFHRLVHQHVLGIPEEKLTRTKVDGNVRRWWQSYLTGQLTDLPSRRYPEIILSAPLAEHRLVAKYDLLAIELGKRAKIVDWKTSRNRPPSHWLAARLQTRVYPYLLVQASPQLNSGHQLEPEQVEMIYWFAEYPQRPERIAYSLAQYEKDATYLDSLAREIEQISQEDQAESFPLTSDEKLCRYCSYRSLCQRGVEAGPLEGYELGWEDDFALDFEQVAEIEY
jgi:CRISPR/Cas system-associated exonuclease Cas4 (RecB family)